MRAEIGRITFPGNPWPAGHAIKEFVWSARLVPASGIWFDFHLESEDYDAEGAGQMPDNEQDWLHPDVWNNYHSCTVSSTAWAEQAEGLGEMGVQVATREQPLDLNQRYELTCDTEVTDPNDWPRPFAIYLLGHDAVAHHQFKITPNADGRTWLFEWAARVALIYGGAKAFEHEFHARVPQARFSGILVPSGISRDEAMARASAFIADAEAFEVVRDGDATWLRSQSVSRRGREH